MALETVELPRQQDAVRARARGLRVMVLGIRGLPDVDGGVETHAQQLYPRLAALGCEVEAIVRSRFVPKGRGAFGAVRLRRLPSPRRAGVEALVHSLLGVVYAGVIRPDILHIHAIGPAIVTPIARLLGLRVVVTHHGPDYERQKWGRFARWVLRVGERAGMRRAHARIAISASIVELVRAKHGVEPELIPNGVPAAEPRVDTQHVRRYGLVPKRYFLHVGRMVPEKRQLDLIRAYALVRDTGWKMALVGAIGSDDYSHEVERCAREAGVVLTGSLKGEALQQIYSHAGAFVLPSSHEGLPIVMLEALSYGLPVIASDIPANLEVGLDAASYFPVGDVSALAERLERLARTPPDDAASCKRRDWVAEKFNWDRIAQQTLAVYLRVRPR
ncbi:MAG TPA: glycosyltransferase family 4 protein [Steroidobacteraceae bacterium]|nr:glycosyltransferase family 4 protein [Steroidobacteraceae bacterium]